jgi:phosphatidylglycerophosphate synthase
MTSAEQQAPVADAVILRATRAESEGARMRVAGLCVLERAITQLATLKLRLVLVSDGSCRLPSNLPAGLEIRPINSPEDFAALRAQIPGAVEVGADEVRTAKWDFARSFRVTDEASRKKAEDAVFAQLLRGDLGIVARHLNKPISFRITRYLLVHLPFTPNHVTIAAALVGLCGVLMAAHGGYAWMVLGFLLAQLQSVLDGCDGELARVRFQQSKVGEWLDTFVDEGLNIMLFACAGIGTWRTTGSTLALALGLSCAAINVLYDAVALGELKRQGRGGDLMHIRWWLAGGIDMASRTGQKRRDPMVLVHGFTRRDFFVFSFLVYAVIGMPFLAVVHASIIAFGQLVLSTAQVGWRVFGREKPAPSAPADPGAGAN